MGKKVLKADTVVKNYWRNNEQFADIFNAVLTGFLCRPCTLNLIKKISLLP